MPTYTTLLDLLNVLQDETTCDAEVIATVVHLVNSRQVRLCGNVEVAQPGHDERLSNRQPFRRRSTRIEPPSIPAEGYPGIPNFGEQVQRGSWLPSRSGISDLAGPVGDRSQGEMSHPRL